MSSDKSTVVRDEERDDALDRTVNAGAPYLHSDSARRPSPPPVAGRTSNRRSKSLTSKERLDAARSYFGDTGDGGMMILEPGGSLVADVPATTAHGIRDLVARVHTAQGGHLPHAIAVTSALSGEGATYVANALGAVLAHDLERPTCIIDLNWWSPTAARPQSDYGLADVLRGAVNLTQAITRTIDDRLFVLPAGFATVSERPVLASSSDLDDVFAELRRQFKHLILDIPAVLPVSESRLLVSRADAFAMVVRHGVTADVQIRTALDDLAHVPSLGVVLNRASSKLPARLVHLISPW